MSTRGEVHHPPQERQPRYPEGETPGHEGREGPEQPTIIEHSALLRRLTGGAQEWHAKVAQARPKGATAIWDLLAVDGECRRALTESSRQQADPAGRDDRDEAEILQLEEAADTPELSAAHAVAAVAAATCAGAPRADLVLDAVTRWADARVPAFDAGLPFLPEIFTSVDPATHLLLAELNALTGTPFRGYLALTALTLLGSRPPVRRRAGLAVRVSTPVLLDRQVEGAVGTLRLEMLDTGPAGLHPDPAVMAFFRGDEQFVESIRRAWSNSPLQASGACVVWSVQEGDGPCNAVEQGSLGGACAVGLHELHRRSRLRGRASLFILDPRSAVTGALDERAERLLPVGGYERKLAAADQAKLRRVVVPEQSYRAPDFPKETPRRLQVTRAASVREAVLRTRNRPNPVYLVATAVIAVVSLVAWLVVGQAAARETAANQKAELESRRKIAERILAQAVSVRSDDPRLALRLGVAAHAIDPDSRYRQVLLETFSQAPISAPIDGSLWAAASTDGRYVVASDGDALQTWDLTTPTSPRRVGPRFATVGTAREVIVAALSPDGNTVAVSTGGTVSAQGGSTVDNTIQLWDISHKEAPTKVGETFGDLGCSGKLAATALAFSPDSRRIAIAGDQGAVTWDLTAPAAPRALHAPIPTDCALAFSPDGRRLATAYGGVQVWDVSAPSTPRPILASANTVRGAGGLWFSPDGSALIASSQPINGTRAGGGGVASGDPDDIEDTTVVVLTAGNHGDLSISDTLAGADAPVAFAPDGTMFTESDNGGVLIWDQKSSSFWENLGEEPLRGTASAATSLTVAAGTGTLLSADAQGVLAWQLVSRRLPHLDESLGAPYGKSAYFPDGRNAVTEKGEIWDITRSTDPKLLSSKLASGSVAVSADGHLAAVAAGPGGATIWNVQDRRNPRKILTLTGQNADSGAHSAAFSPDGSRFAAIYPYHEILLWDLAHPDAPRRLQLDNPTAPSAPVAFSADGRIVAGDKQAWDISDPAGPRRVVGPTGRVQLLPGPAHALLEITDGRITVWRHTDGPRLERLGAFSPPSEADRNQTIVTTSKDGTIVATSLWTTSGGGASNDVLLWDLSDPRTPRQLGTPLTDHTSQPYVAFSPDREMMATAGEDMVLLWDITNPASPRRIGEPLYGYRQFIDPPIFAPDGQVLYSAGDFSALWDLSELQRLRADLIPRSCAAGGSGLSEEEWRRFVAELDYIQTCGP